MVLHKSLLTGPAGATITVLVQPMVRVSHAQRLLPGQLADVGLGLCDEACLAALTDDVLKTSEIEDERLNAASVCSSIALRLGMDTLSRTR